VTGEDGKETATAAGFVMLLGLLFGGVGILIAALAVGIEQAWAGRAARPTSQWTDRVDYHTAWLGQDRKERAAQRKARREWIDAGADPAKEPKRAPRAKRFAGWLHRAWSRLAVGTDRTKNGWARFRDGFRRGLDNARRISNENGTVADMWRNRHGLPDPQEDDEPESAPPADTRPDEDPIGERRRNAYRTDIPPVGSDDNYDPPAAPQPTTTTKETPMTAPAATTAETNLDLLVDDLNTIAADLGRATDLNDQLAAVAQILHARAQDAAERAARVGATATTNQALDEVLAVAAQISRQVGAIADLATAAQDATNQAVAGLRPAQDAQDTLHTAGARGELVTAASD
jgi:hypothetical protein